MIDFLYRDLFKQPGTDKQYVITVYDTDGTATGTVITNNELYYQSIEIKESLCSEKILTYGKCESSSIKFTVASSVGSLKNKKLVVTLKIGGHNNTPLSVGTYYVDSDKLSSDRKSREIVAYDIMNQILVANVSDWYSSLEFPMTLKNFRDSFFSYLGIQQIAATLVNDSMPITQTILPEGLSGKTVVEAICGANGAFGQIRNDQFRYVILKDSETTYYTSADYKIGTLVHDDYDVTPPTYLTIISNKATVTVGTNVRKLYTVEDNFLFYDMLADVLNPYAWNLLDVIRFTPSYKPIQFETYGDLCVEAGDEIVITDTDDAIYRTFCMEKITKGLLSLSDSFSTEGSDTYDKDLNSTGNKILTIWNNTKVLIEQLNGSRAYVYAQRNKSRAYTLISTNFTQIVNISVATVDVSIPVFLATIPIDMNADGEVIFHYFIDGVRIESDEDIVYLHKGLNIVTLCNYIELDANVSKTFSVKAKTAYRESEERKQKADILSIQDWINNQSIEIDETTGDASFTYEYEQQDVDNTPPGAIIPRGQMRALLFGSGLAPQEPWDGNILVVDKVTDFEFITPAFEDVREAVTVEKLTPTAITLSDNVTDFTFIVPTVENNILEMLNITLHQDSVQRTDESGEYRVTEDGNTRYTEGE